MAINFLLFFFYHLVLLRLILPNKCNLYHFSRDRSAIRAMLTAFSDPVHYASKVGVRKRVRCNSWASRTRTVAREISLNWRVASQAHTIESLEYPLTVVKKTLPARERERSVYAPVDSEEKNHHQQRAM